MIETLISSKTRIKLLLKFFLHEGTRGYLRGLEAEFGESSNAIRLELNRLVKAGFLSSEVVGNKRMFRANEAHPLYDNLRALVRKHVGLDRIVETVVAQLGDLEQVYLTGAFRRGLDAGVIELVLVGEVDESYLQHLIERAELTIGRKVECTTYSRGAVLTGLLEKTTPRPLLVWDRNNLAAA